MKKKKLIKVLPLVLASGIALVGCDNNNDQVKPGPDVVVVESLKDAVDKKIKDINAVKLVNTEGMTKKSIAAAEKKLTENKNKAIETVKAAKTVDDVKKVTVDVKSAQDLLVKIALEKATVNTLSYEVDGNTFKMFALVDEKGDVQDLYSKDSEEVEKRVLFEDALPSTLTDKDGDILTQDIMKSLKEVYDRNLKAAKELKQEEINNSFEGLEKKDKTSASINEVEQKKVELETKLNEAKIIKEVKAINVLSKEALQELLKDIALLAGNNNTVTLGDSEESIVVVTDEDNKVIKVLDSNGNEVLSLDSKELKLNGDALLEDSVNSIVDVVNAQKEADDLNKAKAGKIAEINAVPFNVEGKEKYTEESLVKAEEKLEEDKLTKIEEVEAATTLDEVNNVALPTADESVLVTKLSAAKAAKTQEINAVEVTDKAKYTEESLAKAEAKLATDKQAKIDEVEAATTVEDVNKVELPTVDESLLETKEAAAKRKLSAAKVAKMKELQKVKFSIDNEKDYTDESVAAARQAFAMALTKAIQNVTLATSVEQVEAITVPTVDESILVTKLTAAKAAKTEELSKVEFSVENQQDYTDESVAAARQAFEEALEEAKEKVEQAISVEEVEAITAPTVNEDLLETKAAAEAKKLAAAKTAKKDAINAVKVEGKDKYTDETVQKAEEKLATEKLAKIGEVDAATTLDEVNNIALPTVDTNLLETKEAAAERKLQEAKTARKAAIEAVPFEVEEKGKYTEESLQAAEQKLAEAKQAKIVEVEAATTVEGVNNVELPTVEQTLLQTKLDAAKEAKTGELSKVEFSVENQQDYTDESVAAARQAFETALEEARAKVEQATSVEEVEAIAAPTIDEYESILVTKLAAAKTARKAAIEAVPFEVEEKGKYTEESLQAAEQKLAEAKQAKIAEVDAATTLDEVNNIALPTVEQTLLQTKLDAAKEAKTGELSKVVFSVENQQDYTNESVAAARRAFGAALEEAKEKVEQATSVEEVEAITAPTVNEDLLETKAAAARRKFETAKVDKYQELSKVEFSVENQQDYTDESVAAARQAFEEALEEARAKVEQATSIDEIEAIEAPTVNEDLLVTKSVLEAAKEAKYEELSGVTFSLDYEDSFTSESVQKAREAFEAALEEAKGKVEQARTVEEVEAIKVPEINRDLLKYPNPPQPPL